MKLPLYLGIALVVTLLLFSFMRQLIEPGDSDAEQVDIAAVVELLQAPPPAEQPEPEPEPEPEEMDEPSMEALDIAPSTSQPQLDAAPDIGDFGDLSIFAGNGGSGQYSVPVAGKLNELLEGGKDAKGFVEVVPYSTRQPNIPELAWKNKLNGWVLVVFSITTDGHTENIKVLDASPRGIFEEDVVKAVKSWRYAVGELKDYRGNMVLTQKIELFWKDYPQNMDY